MKGSGTSARSTVAIVLALVALAGGGVTSATAQTTLEKIKQKGEILIGTSGVYPPFEFVEAGELVGFDIDLGRLIAEKLGVKARFIKIEWKGIIAALKSGRSDILITAMSRTPDREAQIAFSIPYYKSGMAIITRKDNAAIQTRDDLKGKVLGAEQGSRGEVEAKSVGAREVKIYETVMLAFKDLEHGRVEAVTEMLPASLYMISRQFKSLRIATSYNKGDVGVNARLEDKDLMAAINGAIEQIKAAGKLRELNRKWFGDLYTPDV
jgi:ABC-type amino acid transport substrate-binding protein